jgi:hypothetical protein
MRAFQKPRFDLLNCREASHNVITVVKNKQWYVNLRTLSQHKAGKYISFQQITLVQDYLSCIIKVLGIHNVYQISLSEFPKPQEVHKELFS